MIKNSGLKGMGFNACLDSKVGCGWGEEDNTFCSANSLCCLE